MKRFLSFVGVLISTLVFSHAQAGSLTQGVKLSQDTLAGTVQLGLNGVALSFDVNPVFHKDGTISYLGVHKFEDGNKTSFSITADPDPGIVYGLVFGPTPGPGPNNYTFDFSQPFLGGPYDSIHQDFSGSATFGTPPATGGSVTSINVRADVNGAYVNGVDLLGFSCASGTNGSIACGQGSADSAIPAVSAPGTLSVHVEATVSGPADVWTGNGQVQLNAAPEPTSLLLLGSGLIGLAWRKGK